MKIKNKKIINKIIKNKKMKNNNLLYKIQNNSTQKNKRNNLKEIVRISIITRILTKYNKSMKK